MVGLPEGYEIGVNRTSTVAMVELNVVRQPTGGYMKINQKELRAWAWWVLTLVTLVDAFHYSRYIPLPSGSNFQWDRLRHRLRLVAGANRVCYASDSIRVIRSSDMEPGR